MTARFSRMSSMVRHWSGIMAFAPSIAVVRAFSTSTVEFQTGRSKAGDWDAGRYSKNAAFVPELGKHMLELLAPRTGERILDVGCGDGVLTAELKAKGCRVVGIDFAPDMVAAAINRDIEAYVMDATAIDAPFLLSKINESPRSAGTTLMSSPPPPPPNDAQTQESRHDENSHDRFSQRPQEEGAPYPLSSQSSSSTTSLSETPVPVQGGVDESGDSACRDLGSASAPDVRLYDAVFTNAALHWVRAPRAVIDGAKRVLRPGGRFVGEFGGHGNIAAVRVAMHAALWRRGIDPLTVDPWFFPTAEEYRALLEEAGFIVDDVALVPRPMILPAGTGMRGWLSTFTPAFVNAILHKEIPRSSSSGEETGASDPAKDSNGLTETAAIVLDEALASLQPALCDKNGVWTADYVRLTFRAHLPEDGTALESESGSDKGSGW